MTERISLSLWEKEQAHRAVLHAWRTVKSWIGDDRRFTLEIRPEKRSDAQNRRLWAMLSDISQQVEWYGRKLTPSDWKNMFTAALKQYDTVPGIEGGTVVLGQSTSKMTKKEMGDLQTLMEAFGAKQGVQFKAVEGEV
jgi:hypothetical protein